MASLRNTPGKLTFARRPAKAPPFTSNSLRSRKRSMSKGSILVVDDESEIREGLEVLLKSEGYGVSSAETGESGLAKLEQHPFDLLLLDVSLPDRNGLDILKEIHRRDPQLSIVLITAYVSIEMARAAFATKTSSSSAPSSSASVFPASSARATRCRRSWTSLPRWLLRAPPSSLAARAAPAGNSSPKRFTPHPLAPTKLLCP